MVTAQLIALDSPDLEADALPADPTNCSVVLNASIGPNGSPGAENFAFTAVTPRYLQEHGSNRWGRGILILDEFSWPAVERMVQRLISHASAASWTEVAQKLNKELWWEFDNYTEHTSRPGAV